MAADAAVGVPGDLLDLQLGITQPRLAMAAQQATPFIGGDSVVKFGLPAFELLHKLLKFRQSGLEAERGDVGWQGRNGGFGHDR